MKKLLFVALFTLFFGGQSIDIHAEKHYTFLNILDSRIPDECRRCEKGLFFRGDTEKLCDTLEKKTKEYYETGKTPPKIQRSVSWGIIEGWFNSRNGAGTVNGILGEEKSAWEIENAFEEWHDLACFLARNSLVHPVGRTIEEWNEDKDERLQRLGKEFQKKRKEYQKKMNDKKSTSHSK